MRTGFFYVYIVRSESDPPHFYTGFTDIDVPPAMCCNMQHKPGRRSDMETATIREVQHNLAAYVRRVEQGEEIVIRRRNRTVARLAPPSAPMEPRTDVDWGELREWRRRVWGGKPLPGKPVSQIVHESRGDR